MGHNRGNGSDKPINSTFHISKLSKQKASTLQDRLEIEIDEEEEMISLQRESERLGIGDINHRNFEGDISDSNTVEPYISDERENVEESFKNINIRMGERLTDDIIDAYCDKLQESVDREVDGMLAMQYILLEPNAIKNLIKGDKNICQVIYDHCRAHYLVLFRDKLNPKRIVVYDPIVPHHDSVRETLNDSVREQILTIFGHLYQDDEIVEIAVETGLSTQNDCWSCGLRAVAFITHLLLGFNPANYEYDLEKVREFITEIIKMDRPNRKIIASGQFSRKRNGDKSCLTIVRVTKSDNFSIENGTDYIINKQSSVESILNDNKNDVNKLNKVEEKLSKLYLDNNSSDSNDDKDNSRNNDGNIDN
ncbi:hypothetical protein DINM_000493 [Dirofilaria immitis]|nr:hypothetical protein [Dirofilaria immitis]